MAFLKPSIALFLLILTVTATQIEEDVKLPLSGLPDSHNPDEVLYMPGQLFPLNFRHYSGYLNSLNASHLHYWFFESASNQSTKDPVVFWLNGGPGCSALLGALDEQGPLHLLKEGHHLVPNKYAWNERTNFVYLESPAGTGFSYNDAKQYKTSDNEVAKLSFEAIKSFFKKYPHLEQNDFYIAGEGYGGVFVPTLAQQVLDNKYPVHFAGMAIGNGYLDQNLLGNSLLLFAYYHGLYDTDLWDPLVSSCCAGVQNFENCDFVNNKQADCKQAIVAVNNKLQQSKINWYDIYAKCDNPPSSAQGSTGLSRQQVDRKYVAKHLLKIDDERVMDSMLASDGDCLNYDYVANYLNQKDVRAALHIKPESQNWQFCTWLDYTMQYDSMLDLVRSQAKAGVKTLIYNGDTDSVSNYLGDLWFAQQLGFKTVVEYTPWTFNGDGQVAGYVKVYDPPVAYTTIRGSGHFVPQDKKGPAQQMFYKFIDS